MSSGRPRNVRSCRRAPTPFYPLTRPRPTTTRHQVSSPPCEIIEISSDDEDESQAPVTIPTNDLSSTDKNALDAATAEVACLRTAIQKVMSARESSLECSICWAIFKNLHSFCAGCLKEWFQSCWTLWLDGIPVHPIGTSRDISTLPLPPTVLSRVAVRSGLPFTCPLCRDSLGLQPPCKVIAFFQLSDAISSNLGGAQGEDDPVTVWTGYFP
ncbi:hypothetical protein M405DRAFT_845661 [Rhizopogon salebrosus TDB-379]|nr:hypothetical protein M405DRAFT_845661 [Rhizopogon salebrosus TDB-379]